MLFLRRYFHLYISQLRLKNGKGIANLGPRAWALGGKIKQAKYISVLFSYVSAKHMEEETIFPSTSTLSHVVNACQNLSL